MNKVRVDVDAPLHEQVEQSWNAVVAPEVDDAGQDPRWPDLMVRGGQVVRRGPAGLERVPNAEALAYELSKYVQYEKTTARGLRVVKPPRDMCAALLRRPDRAFGSRARVSRIVDHPVLTSTGWVARPGFDETSGLYYVPAPGLERLEEVHPPETKEDMADVRDYLLEDLLGDFDFEAPSDRAAALALLLLPFVRDYIGDHPTPMHVATAPAPGSGKGYLVQAALFPAHGQVTLSPGPGRNDDEWRKVITAALMRGTGVIAFDNLTGTLDSASLAAALTAPHWQDRVLGSSEVVQLDNRAVWCATGNNLDLADEQVRRMVVVNLAPGEVPAAEREARAFQHPDLLGWAADNRRNLAQCALTLVAHWYEPFVEDARGVYHRGEVAEEQEVGRKFDPTLTLGSYMRWGEVMGGILKAAEVPGFLEDHQSRGRRSSDEFREAAAFLETWQRTLPDPVKMGELIDALQVPGSELAEDLPRELQEYVRDRGRLLSRLSPWLRHHRGRYFYGRVLDHDGGRRRRWEVRGKGDDT